MLSALPGIFCAGEMLDWEAPTGGYLLTACLASGHAAGRGSLAWLADARRRAAASRPAPPRLREPGTSSVQGHGDRIDANVVDPRK